MYNRAGTRTGRATWGYLAYIATLILLHLPEHITMWLVLTAPIILLFNRLDRSGPTVEEVRAREKSRMDSSSAYHYGIQFSKWIRRRLH